MSMGHISLRDMSQVQQPPMYNSHIFFENNNWEQFNFPKEKDCDCKPKILLVDDTAFNLMAVEGII